MRVFDFLIKLLEEANGNGHLLVKVDATIPIPIDGFFEIKKEKGFILLKPKESKSAKEKETGELAKISS